MKKISLLLLATMLVFSFVACSDDDASYIVSFSADGNSKLLVNNADDVRIVLFKDDVAKENLMGGVPGKAQGFGVPNAVAGFYIINAVTYDDWAKLGTSAKICFSTVVFVDSSPATYPVAASLTGAGEFRIVNSGDFYIEVREDSIYGSTLTVLRPSETKLMNLPQKDMRLFPILRKERRAGANIIGLSEKPLLDKADMFSVGESTIQWTISTSDEVGAEHSVAYIRVVNGSGQGVNMLTGTGASATVVKNSLGREIINNGSQLTDSVYFPLKAATYAFSFKNVLGADKATLASLALVNGRVYTITLTSGSSTATYVDEGTYETVYTD